MGGEVRLKSGAVRPYFRVPGTFMLPPDHPGPAAQRSLLSVITLNYAKRRHHPA